MRAEWLRSSSTRLAIDSGTGTKRSSRRNHEVQLVPYVLLVEAAKEGRQPGGFLVGRHRAAALVIWMASLMNESELISRAKSRVETRGGSGGSGGMAFQQSAVLLGSFTMRHS